MWTADTDLLLQVCGEVPSGPPREVFEVGDEAKTLFEEGE